MANRLVDSTDINGYPLDEIITSMAPLDLPKGDRRGGGEGKRQEKKEAVYYRRANGTHSGLIQVETRIVPNT